MKHNNIKAAAAAFALLLTGAAFAPAYGQNMWDAYLFSQQTNEGSARSVAMGNAFVALGGDMGAISINPASSGVYTYNEFIFTGGVTSANSHADYLGNSLSTGKTRFGVPNFGFVSTFNTGRRSSGLISWNLALAFNKTNNFTSRMSAGGTSAESSYLQSMAQGLGGIHATNLDMNSYNDPFFGSGASWKSILAWNTSLLDTLPDSGYDYYAATENLNGYNIVLGGPVRQYFTSEKTGSVSEAVINFGGNISNKFYFGINLGIVNVWYNYNEFYSESALDSRNFNSGFENFTMQYRQKTTGTGVNLKAGIIYLPMRGLRIGASISTPTWLYLSDEWEERVTSSFNDGYSQDLLSPLGKYDYRLDTPFRWNVGVAYTIGNIAVVSADYESVNYSQMKLSDYDYPGYFAEENAAISSSFTTADIFRAGAEVRLAPEFAVRAGYQYYNEGYKFDSTTTQIGSFGIGYSGRSGFFIDAAYLQKLKRTSEDFTLYDDIIYSDSTVMAPSGTNRYTNWKLLVSIGIRF